MSEKSSRIIHGTEQILQQENENESVLWSMVGVCTCNVEPWPSDSRRVNLPTCLPKQEKN